MVKNNNNIISEELLKGKVEEDLSDATLLECDGISPETLENLSDNVGPITDED